MGTHFDHGRGRTAGRCLPETFTAPNGARCFVLGSDPSRESVDLSPEDYTEVRQIVDCTDVDLLVATLDTVGQAPGFYRDPPGWSADPDELWRFDGDPASDPLINRVIPVGHPAGFPLGHVGDIAYDREHYSGAETVCRVVPIGTTIPTHLIGTHDPAPLAPGTVLQEYTLQAWLQVDLDDIVTSWGWNMPLVQYLDHGAITDGLRLDLIGLTGPYAHGWYPYVTHYNGGASSGAAVLVASWVTSPWMQFSLVFEWAVSPTTNRVKMYVNDFFAGALSIGITQRPTIPPTDGFLQIFHQNTWGSVDNMRMLQRALSPAEIATSYTESITPGPWRTTRWRMEIRIGGAVYAARDIVMGERRRWTDFVAPVRRLRGPQEVAVRLTLKEEL
jgi:hypothetical protein